MKIKLISAIFIALAFMVTSSVAASDKMAVLFGGGR